MGSRTLIVNKFQKTIQVKFLYSNRIKYKTTLIWNTIKIIITCLKNWKNHIITSKIILPYITTRMIIVMNSSIINSTWISLEIKTITVGMIPEILIITTSIKRKYTTKVKERLVILNMNRFQNIYQKIFLIQMTMGHLRIFF